MNKWVFYLKEIIKKMWFRCCLYCLFALFAFFSGSILGEFVPNGLKQVITMEGVSDILKILASSMLAVTTFSLSIMVQAFSAAATTATPRANRLLMEDSTAQNALGSFIGAFLFSIIGIIGINSKIYDQDITVMLFLFTVIMIVVIIVMLLRWIDQLSRLGRVTVTIDLVEKALSKSILARAEHPMLECRELVDIDEDSHKSHHAIVITSTVACTSTYDDTLEKVGIHKRDIMIDRIEDTQESQKEGQEQFASALKQFKSIVNVDPSNLEKRYDELDAAYNKSLDAAIDIRSNIKKVESVSKALFAEWKEEIKSYSNQTLKNYSHKKLNQTEDQYEKLLSTMKKVSQDYHLFWV